MANFASSVDGVVALGGRGPTRGGEITGFDPEDRQRMAVLRALSDVVVVGAGTVRSVPRHTWTAEHLWPEARPTVASFRRATGRSPQPWIVVVSGTGSLPSRRPMFRSGEVEVLVVTTPAGARRLRWAKTRPWVHLHVARTRSPISAGEILGAIARKVPRARVLLEGGPHLFGTFLDASGVDELFLTISPQVAGRGRRPRLGLSAGVEFAPDHPRWGRLIEARVGRRMLFLRYRFDRPERRRVSTGPSRGARLNRRGG